MEDLIFENEEFLINTKLWPNSRNKPLKIKSPITPKYNCVAYSLNREDIWYESIDNDDIRNGLCVLLQRSIIWPEALSKGILINNYLELYKLNGFEKVNDLDISVEVGYVKIAIYGNTEQVFTHVCRQMEDGKWVSKLGSFQDVEHDDLEVLEGSHYGKVMVVMKKKILV